jgi:hypothetical protein
MIDLFLVLPKDSENLNLGKAQLFEPRCPGMFYFPILARGCQVVNAQGCVVISPMKTFTFAFFVFQLHFLLLQLFAPFIVFIFGINQTFVFSSI